MDSERCNRLKAIESLRGGVPNRDVVRFLPPNQADIDQLFAKLLSSAEDIGNVQRQPGILLEGGFGSGKTHWLETLRNQALESGFVCSWITLNKETPLFDLAKVYRSCVLTSAAPGRIGPAIQDIVSDYDPDRAPGYREFHEWVRQMESKGLIDYRLFMSLILFGKTNDDAVRLKVLDEWMGFPIRVPELRENLREVGEKPDKRLSLIVKDNYQQRLEFIARLLKSVGYKGWCILVDEAEFISKYSFRQRAKSYANLAKLIGTPAIVAPSGVGVVAAIAPDYVSAVLRGTRKNDMEDIPVKLSGTKDAGTIGLAMSGMHLIDTSRLSIKRPTQEDLRTVYDVLSKLYSAAYDGWVTTDVFGLREYSSTTSMRQYIRLWINAWDLERLYEYVADQGHSVVEDVVPNLEEDETMQSETDEDEPIISY